MNIDSKRNASKNSLGIQKLPMNFIFFSGFPGIQNHLNNVERKEMDKLYLTLV